MSFLFREAIKDTVAPLKDNSRVIPTTLQHKSKERAFVLSSGLTAHRRRLKDHPLSYTPSCPLGLMRHTEVFFLVSVFISMTSTIIPISSWMIAYHLPVDCDIPNRQGLLIVPPLSICPFLLKEHSPPAATATSARMGMVSWLAYTFIAPMQEPRNAPIATITASCHAFIALS